MPQNLTAIYEKTLTMLLSPNILKIRSELPRPGRSSARTSEEVRFNLLFCRLDGVGTFQGVTYVFCTLSKPLLNRISEDIVSGNIIWVSES